MKAILTRHTKTANGTFGTLSINGEDLCYTVERPWLDNAPNVSCIPVGSYTCVKCSTGKTMPTEYEGETYEVAGVPGRSLIKVHIANCPHELQGCIAPTTSIDLATECGGNSTAATRKVMDALHGVPSFELVIREV